MVVEAAMGTATALSGFQLPRSCSFDSEHQLMLRAQSTYCQIIFWESSNTRKAGMYLCNYISMSLVPVREHGASSPPVRLKHGQHSHCPLGPPGPPQGWCPSCPGEQPACALVHTGQGVPGWPESESHRWSGGAEAYSSPHCPAWWWEAPAPPRAGSTAGTWHYSPGRGSRCRGGSPQSAGGTSLP